jgi:hypothetical protein
MSRFLTGKSESPAIVNTSASGSLVGVLGGKGEGNIPGDAPDQFCFLLTAHRNAVIFWNLHIFGIRRVKMARSRFVFAYGCRRGIVIRWKCLQLRSSLCSSDPILRTESPTANAIRLFIDGSTKHTPGRYNSYIYMRSLVG